MKEREKIFDLRPFFGASKRASYQMEMKHFFKIYINFFQSNGLTKSTILQPGESPDLNTKIYPEDLTDEGYELLWDTDHSWFEWVDRGGDPEDTSLLTKRLEQIRCQYSESESL